MRTRTPAARIAGHDLAVHRWRLGEEPELFRAHCSCGWMGRQRFYRDTAADDARSHLQRASGTHPAR